MLGLCAVLTLVLGKLKVELQQRHPPVWAQTPDHRFEGYVSIDGHAQRAALVRAVVLGQRPVGTLRRDLASQGHATSVVVPAAVAVLSLAVGSIPGAFWLLVSAAFVAVVAGVVALARRVEGASRRMAGAAAGVVFAGHCLAVRTTGQLHLDMVCALLYVAMLLIATGGARGVGTVVGTVAVALLGLFTKVSCLPLLAIPVLAALQRRAHRRRLLLAGAAAVLACGVAFVVHRWWLGGGQAGIEDMQHLYRSWTLSGRELLHFALEMALLFQLLPLLALVRGRVGEIEKVLLACLATTLVATWAFRLPAVPRLYLPVLAMLACWAGPRLLRRPAGWQRRAVAAYLTGNYGVAVLGMLL